jgi:hypothetical protein
VKDVENDSNSKKEEVPIIIGLKLDLVKPRECVAAMYALLREIVQASDWDGDFESQLCVNESKKRKL